MAGLQREGEQSFGRDHLSPGSLPKWLQWLQLGQLGARSSIQVSHVGAAAQVLGSSAAACRHISSELDCTVDWSVRLVPQLLRNNGNTNGSLTNHYATTLVPISKFPS